MTFAAEEPGQILSQDTQGRVLVPRERRESLLEEYDRSGMSGVQFSIMATNHWVRKIQILNDGLKLSIVVFSDLAAEDHGDFLGLSNRAVAIQQSLAELIHAARR